MNSLQHPTVFVRQWLCRVLLIEKLPPAAASAGTNPIWVGSKKHIFMTRHQTGGHDLELTWHTPYSVHGNCSTVRL